MTISEDTLQAYVDGELDAAARAQVEAAIAADPQLASRVQQHRALRKMLSAAYDPVLNEPIPNRLRDAAEVPETPTKVVDLGSRRAGPRPGPAWTWVQWGGMAAALLVGVLVGRGLPFEAPGNDIVAEGGELRARGRLAEALSTQLASTQAADAPVKIGLSYLSRAGGYCRSFALAGTPTAGVACRQGDAWELQLLAHGEPAAAGAATGNLRMAASPAPVLRLIEEQIRGSPLDAQGERAAVQKAWRE